MNNNKHDDFGNDIGDEVERFLRGAHSSDDEPSSKTGKGKPGTPQHSDSYEEVKDALQKVFEMCEKHGFSIQVAISDEPLNEHGEKGQRITVCGHMSPDNIPCEMVAAAAVYQTHHLFSHMVLAMASAGMPLITDMDEDEDE